MATTSKLRTVGGSVMMAIPKPLLEVLGLSANSRLELTVEDGKLVAVPRTRPRYTLDEIMAQCDLDTPASADEDDRDWMDNPPMGREAL